MNLYRMISGILSEGMKTRAKDSVSLNLRSVCVMEVNYYKDQRDRIESYIHYMHYILHLYF